MSSRKAYPKEVCGWGEGWGRGAVREVNVLPFCWISQPRWCFTQEEGETDPVRDEREAPSLEK